MSSANNDATTLSQAMPLRDWIALADFFEARETREASDPSAVEDASAAVRAAKNVRIESTSYAIHVARLIVDRLVFNEENPEGVNSSDAGQRPALRPEDIKAENFLVGFVDPNVDPTGSISASEIMGKCNTQQIKRVLQSSVKVDLVPSLQGLSGIKLNESLQDHFFQQLGHVFFELFTKTQQIKPLILSDQENVQSAHYQNSQHDRTSTNQNFPVDSEDEEEQGVEKGRRKCSAPGARKTSKNQYISGPMDVLQQKSLPMSVCRLVTDLMEAGLHEENTFKILNDVNLELAQMMCEPEFFLHEVNIGKIGLAFSNDKLHGRNEELAILIRAMASAPLIARSLISNVVIIGGLPGSGKSCLVNSLKGPLFANGGHFLSCKFDRLTQNQPLSIISLAFDEFFRNISTMKSEVEDGLRGEADREYVQSIAASVEGHLSSSGIVLLSKLIPSFRSLFPDIFQSVVIDDDESDFEDAGENVNENPNFVEDEDEDGLVGGTVRNRLHYLFQKLTHAISSPEVPLVIFVDDLQWATEESLDLWKSLIVDVDHLGMRDAVGTRCVCFVAAYRNNVESKNDNLVQCIGAIQKSNTARVTRLDLGGLTTEGTNAMISDAMKLPSRITRPLAEVVHTKTLGNPFFTRAFMLALSEDGTLSYSLAEKRWMWDINEINGRSVDEDVAVMMSLKLLRMPEEVQEALTFVSCFGMRVDKDILSLTSGAEEYSDRVKYLDLAAQEGILENSEDCYSFPHDLIQQASYERVSHDDICQLHFDIGMQLLHKVAFSQHDQPLNSTAFIAIDQINMAKYVQVTDPTLRFALAALLLKAGKHGLAVAAFPSALSYFVRGLHYLGSDGWQLQYDLSLQLHESACQACYLNAMPDRVSRFFNEIISHTNDFMDQLKTHYIVVQTLSSTGKVNEAINKFFAVMKELGEELPIDPTPPDILAALVKTKNALSQYSTEDLLNMPKMSDCKRLWALMFMEHIMHYIVAIHPQYLPLIASKIVILSLEHGLANQTAFGLQAYSYCLVRILSDIDGGYQWSKVTRQILERLNAQSVLSRLNAFQYSFVNYWKEPFQAVVESLYQSRNDAMMAGDFETALSAAYMHCAGMIFTGAPLSNAEKECAAGCAAMVRLKQFAGFPALVSLHGMAIELSGSDQEQFDFSGMTDKDETANRRFVENSTVNSMITAYFFRRYESAADMFERHFRVKRKEKVSLKSAFYIFYEGLVAFQKVRSQVKEPKWLAKGNEAIATFESWVKHSEWNFENKLLLLEAESNRSKGEIVCAEKKYIASIESARRHRFVHEEGLAMDLLASFYKDCGNTEKEKECLQRTYVCYENWGAHGLLKHIRV